jgi:D-glycero-D-manno-heptose 1,7-bisphosphate phosphatase
MTTRQRPAVFFDRDGVLAREIVRDGEAYAPTSIDDFRLVHEAADAVRRIKAAGALAIVFTNQPEVARGLLAPQTLEAMHRLLREQVAVDDVITCPHDDAARCACRKPQPGMLRAAAERWGVDLTASFVIGDRWRDIEAGRAVGAYTVLLERPYSACTTADAVAQSLTDAVAIVLERLNRRRRA